MVMPKFHLNPMKFPFENSRKNFKRDINNVVYFCECVPKQPHRTHGLAGWFICCIFNLRQWTFHMKGTLVWQKFFFFKSLRKWENRDLHGIETAPLWVWAVLSIWILYMNNAALFSQNSTTSLRLQIEMQAKAPLRSCQGIIGRSNNFSSQSRAVANATASLNY